MLSVLFIRNVVLIDETEVHFGRGLNVLSGETGAGKTIILSALGLALGYRADIRLVRQGCDEGEVEAVFDLPFDGKGGLRDKIRDLLFSHEVFGAGDGAADGAGDFEKLILRRIIYITGRSRAYVNGVSVSVGTLHDISKLLMEVQGHFEQQGLLNVGNHRNFLDIFSNSEGLLEAYQSSYIAFRDFEKHLLLLRGGQVQYKEDVFYLRSQIDELVSLNLSEDEESRLDSQRHRLKNSVDLIESGQALDADMDGDGGLGERLQKHVKLLERSAEHDENARRAMACLRRSLSELMDASGYLQSALGDLSEGEESLDAVESRLFHLRALARKHECDVGGLPLKLRSLQDSLTDLEESHGSLEEQEKKYVSLKQGCETCAEALTAQRVAGAMDLDEIVMSILPQLKLEKALFRTSVIPSTELRFDGCDIVSFMVRSNPGASEAVIGKVASAGELSRFLLALRSAFALREEVRLEQGKHGASLVFDEVDSGIGGATAHAVGLKLSHLASSRQVILITHSAQAAAFADEHFFVGKEQGDDSTRTEIRKLGVEEKQQEIARMLSGDSVTEAALAQSRLLIQEARSVMGEC